jgi:hypothetical protein
VTTSRVPAVLDYLVITFTASSVLAAVPLGDARGVTVYDGPPTTALNAPLSLYVGLTDPDSEGGEVAADTAQAWAALGHQARNEQLTIHCVAEAWSGVDDIRTVRVAAYAITSAVEDIVRGDSTLGGTVTVPGNAAVTAMSLAQNNTDRGAIARISFEITAQARIGG